MIPQVLDTIVQGAAGNSNYTFPFRTFESQDVGVKVRLVADGTETQLDLTTHFTLNGIGDLGGSIDLVNGAFDWIDGGNLKAGYVIFTYYIPNTQQLTKLRDLGRNSPWELEKALDRLTMIVKGFFEGIGDVARSLKLPSNIHPDEFSPILPSDLNVEADSVIAVNDTKNGFKMANPFGIGEPGDEQIIAGGGTIAVVQSRRQHVRIKGVAASGKVALSNTPFGNNDSLLVDGMEIVVEANSGVDFHELAENDNDYGYLGNGGIQLRYPYVVTFIYNADIKRFKLKSNGAW